MPVTVLAKLLFYILLAIATHAVAAGQPCAPFEDDRVDSEILRLMREAASDGRLYRVDPNNSRVGFCVRHFPGREFRGEFTNIVGGLAFPPALAEDGQALLLIHTASLSSENTGLLPLVTGHDFIDTSNYPEILFVGHTAHWENRSQGHIHGDLTMRGITQPVTFELAVRTLDMRDNDLPGRILLKGRSEVKRTDFDMRSYRFFVSETVRLCMNVELVRWE
jgi:polyisoprenoid-binding protein YceI